MVTRQVRLTTSDQFRQKLGNFKGEKINIVLFNRKVLFGELLAIHDERLTFSNMRLERFTIDLKDISEIYLDFKE